MKKNIGRFLKKLKGRGQKTKAYLLTHLNKRPFESFFVILGLVVILIVLSNILNFLPKKEAAQQATPAKHVNVYQIGSAPRLSVQAQIEKSGVIHITALTSGVVQAIYKPVGEKFAKGEVLISLASNYQGGSAPSLQRQLAQTQYNSAVDTYQLQKDIIQKQREAADKTDVNADDLRSITDKSIGETKDLIALNDDIIKALDEDIATAIDDDAAQAAKRQKQQFVASNNAARQALRSAEYQASGDKAPANLSDIQKNTVLKQLDLQEKMLSLNREVSRIQVQIAQVNEAMFHPAAPFAGSVQRVFVKEGTAVSPGDELMILSQEEESDPITAVAYVSADVARKVSKLEQSTIHIDDKVSFTSYPAYVTQDAVQGTLYGVYFNIPDNYIAAVTEKGYIRIDLPIGYVDSASLTPYVPIDAIYQTKSQNYIFVVQGNKASSRKVELGPVYGNYVEVTRGLKNKDMVILNRTVIEGDAVIVNR